MPAPPTNTNSPCTACGYDLAGLKLPGKCPECGGFNSGESPSTDPPYIPPPRWFAIVRTAWFAAAVGLPVAVIFLPLVRKPVSRSVFPDHAGSLLDLVLLSGLAVVVAAGLLRRWNTVVAVFLTMLLTGILMPAWAE